MGVMADAQLDSLSADGNPYVARTALRLVRERFADRPVPFINTPPLQRWTELRSIHALGLDLHYDRGVTKSDADTARGWAIRFVADNPKVTERDLRNFANQAGAEPSPAVIKAALHLEGRIPTADVRMPMSPASAEAVDRVRAALAAASAD